MPRRVAAANDDRFRSLAIARLDFGRGIVNAGAFEVGEPVERQPAILHAGRDHDCLGTDALSVVEGGAEALILELLEERHPPRHREARPELHRLYLAAPDQVGTGNARREAHVVLDTARGPGLAADRNVFHDQRAQTFGSRIDSRSDPRRPAAHDQHVEHFVVAEIEMEAEQPRDLVGRGIGHDDVRARRSPRARPEQSSSCWAVASASGLPSGSEL